MSALSAPAAIMLAGAFVASSCALVGSFLVLRRLALLGDAISHAVLPGIVIAFFLTGSRASLPMVVGAGALGVLTVFLVEVISRSRRLYEDTSIGVVFPALFSLGVILVGGAGQVDLDLDCVLYGDIAYVPLNILRIGGHSLGPQALWVTGGVLLLDIILVLALYKELKLASFDPDLSGSLGYSPVVLHYVLMTAVSMTVVASFESVGSILVVAMLVVPPATAYLLTDRLWMMLVLAAAIGIASAVQGYFFARWYDCSIAGAMGSSAGLFFVLALVFSPGHGLLARVRGHRRLAERLAAQILLLHLKGRAGAAAVPLPRAELEARFRWSPGRLDRMVRDLEEKALLERAEGGLRLTAAGAEALEELGAGELGHPL